MGYFTVTTKEESIKDFSGDGGNFINESGIYEIIIKEAVITASSDASSKSESLGLWITYNGQDQMLYPGIVTKTKNGDPGPGEQSLNKLAIILGATEGVEIGNPVPKVLPIGKDKSDKECMVLEEFANSPVIIRVQMEYSMYEGKIQERKSIRDFFRFVDKATASEIATPNSVFGTQYNKVSEYTDRVTYRDDLTKEDIDSWKANQKTANKEKPNTTPNKPSTGFGGKKFGNK